MRRYQDRTEAGWRLAVHFADYFKRPEVIVVAISPGGVQVGYEIAQALGAELDVFLLTEEDETLSANARRELERQERYYRGGRTALMLRDRIVILVDDGLSAVSLIKTAIKAARKQEPARLIIAIPVVSAAYLDDISSEADQAVCSVSPKLFQAAGFLYENPALPTDMEVRNLIERAARQQASASVPRAPGG